MIASRRRFLFGAGAALLAAPAIVRVASLMAVKPLPTGLFAQEGWRDVFLAQYKQEFIRGFEAHMIEFRKTVTTEFVASSDNQWLVARAA